MQFNNRLTGKSKNLHLGFTLIEMLVVIGIIAILVSASLTGFSKMMKSAENARARESVSNAATALAAIYQADGMWPKLIRTQSMSSGGQNGEGRLNEKVALILAQRGLMALSMNAGKTQLVGNDRFGVLTPWAAKALSRTKDKGISSTWAESMLSFAVDIDGNGEIDPDEHGRRLGNNVTIRATVAVWCPDKSGKSDEDHRIQSWTQGQTVKVN